MGKIILFTVCVVLLIGASGCNTIKGAGEGAADGFKKDWQAMKKIDDKFQENYW